MLVNTGINMYINMFNGWTIWHASYFTDSFSVFENMHLKMHVNTHVNIHLYILMPFPLKSIHVHLNMLVKHI
jgi:hypothetical protein